MLNNGYVPSEAGLNGASDCKTSRRFLPLANGYYQTFRGLFSLENGQGDVVKELRAACDKYDMKFGVYLSPWDRNAECYGDSPRYNDFLFGN